MKMADITKLCFLCGTKVNSVENDVSMINKRKEICLKFTKFVQRFLNLPIYNINSSDNNRFNISLTSTTTINSVNDNQRDNRDSICCSKCADEIESFCDTYFNLECLQLEVLRILGRISKLITPKSTFAFREQLVSKVAGTKGKRRDSYLKQVKIKRTIQSQRIDDGSMEQNTEDLLLHQNVKVEAEADNIQDVLENSEEFFGNEMALVFEDQKVMENKMEATRNIKCPDVKISKHRSQPRPHKLNKARLTKRKKGRPRKADRIVNCLMCERTFRQRSDMETHMRFHTRERPYFCGVCGREFSASSGLNTHLRKVHFDLDGEARRRQCEICGKAVLDLHSHHTKVHSVKNAICDICGKAFSHPHRLKTHMIVHSAERNWTCDICEKRFKYQNEVARHKRKAHKESILVLPIQ